MIRINNFKSCSLLLAVVFTFSFQSFAQPDGAQIFKANCTACHTIVGGRLVGPDLDGIVAKRESSWLKSWINSSSELIASGDADAIDPSTGSPEEELSTGLTGRQTWRELVQ